MDHVKDAILSVDHGGRIETMNSTAQRIFGYDEDALLGRRLDLSPLVVFLSLVFWGASG